MRFPGFTEGWVTQKFSKVGEFFKGTGISKDKLTENGNPCILYGELYTKYKNEIIKEVFSKTDINTKGLVSSKVNDIIIPSSGESAVDIATACCVNLNDVLLGGDLNIIRPYKDNGNFISYQLNGKRKFEIAEIAQGSSVTHLYNESLKKLDVKIPIDITEQNEIASLLSLIDDRIQTQSKILLHYQSLIQNLRNAIFKKKIRFKDRTGKDFSKWEICKLKDVAERVVQKNFENNQNVLTISAQHGLISQLDFFNKSVSAKNVSGYYLIIKEDFAYNKSYSTGYPMGAIKRLKRYNKGIVSTLYICFRFNSKVNQDYMEHYFESQIQNSELEKISQEGARNHGLLNVGINDFFNIEIQIPYIMEQVEIAKLLSSLNKKLTIEKTILEKFKQQKNYLLQNLFI